MVSSLIGSVIRWAFILGACGGLVDTTIAIRHHAKDATRIGLVSLSLLNHHLMAESSTITSKKYHASPLLMPPAHR